MRNYNALERDALNFLREHATAVLATCYEGKPHATTIYYDVAPDFTFYYLTKRNTQKTIHAAFNPQVALVVGTGPEKITVQASGLAEMLDGQEKVDALVRMKARLSHENIESAPIENMNDLRKEYMMAYRIRPTELVFMNMDCKRYPASISRNYHRIIG